MNSIFNKSRLLNGVAALGLAGTVVVAGAIPSLTPVYAEAVRVEAPQAPSFADVVEAVSPAVVSVKVKAKIQPASKRGFTERGLEGFGSDLLPEDHPLRRFFDRDGKGKREFRGRKDRRGKKRGPHRRGTSQGSGFFVSDDGYIVTNNHVVEGGSEFTIAMNDGKELDAKLIGTDPKTDLAVLKVDIDQKITYVSFSTKKSRVGEWVVAVGNPFGLGGTVTAGIVSANGRDIGSGPYDDFIQIDAAVNKGNSGGPTFNLNGEVIGVNTAIFSPSGGNVGIAFAVAADTAQEVVDDLIKSGSVTRGWLGVQIQPVTEDIAESVGLSKAGGAIVAEVQPNSPAEKSGLVAGDVILKVDGANIKGPKALAKKIAGLEPEETTKVAVFRNGKHRDVDVKLGTLPTAKKVLAKTKSESSDAVEPVDLEELGISVAAADGMVVIAEVQSDSEAADKGIKPGDVIVSVNGSDAKSVNDVGNAVAKAMEDDRAAILFQLKSGQRNRFVALPFDKG